MGETTRRMGRHIKKEQSVKRVLRRDKQKAKKTGRDHEWHERKREMERDKRKVKRMGRDYKENGATQ